ncbi:unnamed protein product [Pseudo-nitzschia multistriata]|uniref:Uncharacterized protein n=1 Tax=Pseudo-nitzschia multistriata TaxID=183589 RepID=A0A448ZBM8_9STRA|nr:unnamed protein product [Pseudo-nitzschia multistriata]
MDLKLIFPSALKCVHSSAFLFSSFVSTLKKAWYSSSVMSSFERVQMAGFPFKTSQSKVVTSFVFFGFSSTSSSSVTSKSSPSVFSSSAALSSSSSTSTSIVVTVLNDIGWVTNSE